MRFFRIGFFHNFSSSLISVDNKSGLYIEVSYSKDRPIDKSNIALRIREDLKKVGLFISKEDICAQDINDIKYGYPIYDAYYGQVRSGILKYLTQKNILSCGRYGSWRYFSMEDVILDGKRAADFILRDA